jgi:hypothetical protein
MVIVLVWTEYNGDSYCKYTKNIRLNVKGQKFTDELLSAFTQQHKDIYTVILGASVIQIV